MAIYVERGSNTFHMKSKNTSYLIKVLDTGHLIKLYWGKGIMTNNLDYLLEEDLYGSFFANTDNIDNFQLEAKLQEYPSFGHTDLRSPAIEIEFEDGSSICDFRYDGYRIYNGKKSIEGLPSTYVEDESESTTLDVYLKDNVKNIKVVLTYTVFEEFDAITKSVKIINDSREKINIGRVLSCNIDFEESEFDLIHLSGSWGRERHVVRTPIRCGSQSIESRRGASSHAQNPFIALSRKNTDEDLGEVYGFSFVYSGNFLANVEVDMYFKTRVQMGINSFNFNWLLQADDEFQTPETVLVYSNKGLNGMSKIYHNLYSNRLCRGRYRDKERPILINNWEATYFDFNDEILRNLANQSKDLGIELFVLDDGWFGKRNNDKSSLGDWSVNLEKIKGGLNKLGHDINEIGLQFGLWFEPEMVSPDSDLYRKHPDWCIYVEGRIRNEARNQLILDLSRKEVCDYIIDSVSNILSSAPISYVKWDMNRNMTEVGSASLPHNRQKEVSHRYILGLYRVLEEITKKFPNVLFESCSGGGGRYDPGMLHYMVQTWTSDNTDAIERLKIQFGTSLVYPSITMGCHVSAVPNHQVQRITSIETRGNVAMCGNLGYELDVTKLTEDEKSSVREQIKRYKKIRNIVQFGDFYRLSDPFKDNEVSWMHISKDKNHIVVGYVRKYAQANMIRGLLRLKNLNEGSLYKIIDTNISVFGDELMNIGLTLPKVQGDYISKQWIIERVNN